MDIGGDTGRARSRCTTSEEKKTLGNNSGGNRMSKGHDKIGKANGDGSKKTPSKRDGDCSNWGLRSRASRRPPTPQV